MDNFSGMTINERLYVANLLDSFHLAVVERNREKLINILKQVDLNEDQAKFTIDTIFSNPNKYGYK